MRLRQIMIVFLACALGRGVAMGVSCPGDCSGDATVSIGEIVRTVAIGLGEAELRSCPNADANKDEEVDIEDAILAVRSSLQGCAPSPTVVVDTATPTVTLTAPATPRTDTATPTLLASSTPAPASPSATQINTGTSTESPTP